MERIWSSSELQGLRVSPQLERKIWSGEQVQRCVALLLDSASYYSRKLRGGMFRLRFCSKSAAFVRYHYYRRSHISSVTTLHQQRQKDNRFARNNPAIAINKKIVDFGKKKQWKEIFRLYEEEATNFNNVNYATMMSQLGRMHSLDRSYPVFLRFMDDLAEMMEQRGLQWIDVRGASNIIHAIGKMNLSNNSARRILNWMSMLENAEELLAKGKPQAISNVAWTFARLQFDSPDYLAAVDKRAQWLVKEGSPQAIANTAWACATLGFEAPNLFGEIDRRSKWLVEEGITSSCCQHCLGLCDAWF